MANGMYGGTRQEVLHGKQLPPGLRRVRTWRFIAYRVVRDLSCM